MKKYFFQARLRRNGLVELSGDNYRDGNSEIVRRLNLENKSAYLGIQDDDGPYTILGRHWVFFSDHEGVEAKISYDEFDASMQRYVWKHGKGASFSFSR